jgi:hypothetical protein
VIFTPDSLVARSGRAQTKLDQTSRRADFDDHRNALGRSDHRDRGSCGGVSRAFVSSMRFSSSVQRASDQEVNSMAATHRILKVETA